MSDQNVLDQFLSAGLKVDWPPVVGELVRCKVEGDGGNKRSGWYVLHELHLDNGDLVYVGRYGNWKNGSGQDGVKVEFDVGGLSEDERARLKAEQEAARQKAAEERRQRAEDAAKRAVSIFDKLPDSGRSDYLQRKKVGAHGLRFSRGSVVVPVRHIDDSLVGLQFIDGEGEKKFLTGTPKRGAFHLIGDLQQAQALGIAEGYATGATVFECAEMLEIPMAVVVAFDAGNLLPVARAWRARCPELPIIIFADDDATTEGNPGITQAQSAAEAVGGAVLPPRMQEAA